MGDGRTAAATIPFTRREWPPDASGFSWFDLTGTELSADEILEAIAPSHPEITAAMIDNLRTPDEKPKGASFDEGAIRLASTFSVHTQRHTEITERGEPEPVGTLVIQPVELLASTAWLISCWHPTRTYCGTKRRAREGPPGQPESIVEAVTASWALTEATCAADLGVLIMKELALTYAPAHRAISSWLEDWELGFYINDPRFDRDDLAHLWGARAVLRDWLVPLNRPGITGNPAKAWLPASDQKLVEDVDDRIDRALESLDKLGDALRSSFSLLHVQQSEQNRQRNDALQRRIEIAAAAFLVPTLVVGFYGANTWVPGERQHWGFWVMVVTLFSFTAFTIYLLTRWHKTQQEDEKRSAEEWERMRAELSQAKQTGAQ